MLGKPLIHPERELLSRPLLSYYLSCMHCTGVHAALLVRAASVYADPALKRPGGGIVQSAVLALAAAGAVSAFRDAIDR